ncbi:MAG: outer membrane lipoprotein carrier protein LolA [Moraxellaceae bacterium]|nr:MAG: outer membrane lipoprotein carrier protein LolA [Moraxellaceae bacterium]
MLNCFLSALAWGDDADLLLDVLQQHSSMQAHFEQSVTDVDGREVQASKGLLKIQKPKQFLWRTSEPFEQEIISDGEKMWVFDVDLDQHVQRAGALAELEIVLGSAALLLRISVGKCLQPLEAACIEGRKPVIDGILRTWMFALGRCCANCRKRRCGNQDQTGQRIAEKQASNSLHGNSFAGIPGRILDDGSARRIHARDSAATPRR